MNRQQQLLHASSDYDNLNNMTTLKSELKYLLVIYFLASPGVITAILVRATTVLRWQAATITIAFWTINSSIVAIPCLARHRLAHIIEHSCHMGAKREL